MAFRSAHPTPMKGHERHLFSISLALSILLFFLTAISFAQNNSSSVSSSSGHSLAASAPSFSSSAPASHAPANSGVTFTTGATHSGGASGAPHSGGVVHHPPHVGSGGEVYYPYPYLYAVPMPYLDADNSDNSADTASDDSSDDAEYQGGPTIFDRRGSGADSYIPPVDSGPAHESQESEADTNASISAEAPSDPTILVFKDGHQLEIENYAVISQTLYDLTPGHRRKIALAELDLPATEKLNDDRGVVFELPSSAQAN